MSKFSDIIGGTLGATIANRFLLGIYTLFIVSILIFSAIAFLPGDYAKAALGHSATPETVAALQKELGLDRPAPERYLRWIGHAAQGDFGSSFSAGGTQRRLVIDIILPRLKNTLLLAGVTALLAVPLALVLGVLTALARNSFLDRLLNAATLTAISFPEFFVAYVLMLLLAVKFPLFSSMASMSADMPIVEKLARIALPVLTLTLVILAHMMRMTRAAIISLLNSSYVECARLKGLPEWRIVVGHVLPNAWAPIANVVAFNLAYLVVGVVVVEVVFVYPGIGQTMVDAIRLRDVPVIQACTLIFAVTFVVLNLLADLIAIATNPRLVHPK
ncbi:ABC transporter permease [Mesorhizobium escarrei]|uniref:ABC transporter permease n=1 Tax=Mesorhizobium escarrei TaxID=666018 RepID=A0ABN8JHE0_9HYPH|nr:ABC transporter permease [Mesorhizobium escarrei]CAH2397059.1 ABC transporter permease [Mesorhizobium escarrei]